MIPIISVIVPAYNVELFIDKCLESLHKQSFDKFEVIIVDDGSTDKTSLIIKSWLKKDLRFKYYYKENGGLSSARNYGLLKSNAEYVSFVDSDDFVAPDFLKTLFLISKLTNSDICQCNFKTVKSDNIFFQKDNSLCLKTINCNEALELLADPSSHLFKDYVWNKLYKRDLFVNTIFLKNTFFEDTEIMYKLLMKCDKICVINCDLYFYRQVSTSIVHSLDFKKLSDYQRIVNERYDKIMHIVNLSYLKHAR